MIDYAAPVTRSVREVREVEREVCAKVADSISTKADDLSDDRFYRNGWRAAAKEIAAAIRRGGQR